jgi:hypothetical protein
MVSIKAVSKLLSIIILSFCAVFICSVFLSLYIDLAAIETLLETPESFIVFEMLITTSKITLASAGGIIGAVILIVLLFSIARFISESSAQLGVMKALGYNENRLAFSFAQFGIAVAIGSAAGYIGSCCLGQVFYNAFDAEKALPVEIVFHFHIIVPVITVVMPSLLSAVAAVLYAKVALKKRPLLLMSGAKNEKISKLTEKLQTAKSDRTFITILRSNMLFSNLVLIFFIGFAAFGFSMQTQMAFTMYNANGGSLFMPIVFVAFGLVMGFVTLLLALSFMYNKNGKYLALLKAFGYCSSEANNMLFGGYRIVTYIGFAIGTVYQYFFFVLIIGFFADAGVEQTVDFSIAGFFITLAVFVAAYELIMLLYKRKIAKSSMSQIMQG